ncbi:hypothetical protein U9M48_025615 [Paspalum notatum var. saurae]|uniref:Phytocyanin domain-containing protein n=1 Tax=Paspalum notatum var. saurae TaxID=547442 RepID=A0AAQ3TQS2_PASNO
MAKSSSCVLGLACFVVAVAAAGATQFTVGGANGWSVPAAGAEPFNTWAEKIRFQIGDSLLFVYPKDQDSVLLVEPADYNACNTSSYVKKFDDGDTVFTLDRSGPLFFISGVEANCRANEKLIVMVLASTGGGNGTGSGRGAPAPSAPAPPPASPSSPPPASPTAPPPSSPTAASPPPAATSAPPPAASAPTTPPPPAPSASSSPAPVSSAPPSAPAGAPQPPPPAPSASSPAPSAHGTTANATGTAAASPPPGSKDKNGAVLTMAATGLAGSLGACVLGYAMLAL